jgi:hypothetical protein
MLCCEAAILHETVNITVVEYATVCSDVTIDLMRRYQPPSS